MNFKNIDEAKNVYLEGNKIARKANIQGDVKTNNKIVKNQINPAFEYLKEQNALKVLIPFLEQDDDIDLKQSTAIILLPYYEEIAVNVLEDISNRNISNSFISKMVLEQWKEGSY